MKALLYSLCFTFLLSLGFLTLAQNAHADAEQFKTLHCNKCHEISAQKITVDKKGGDEEEDEDEDAEVPDLSHSGKDHDAAFFKKFLAKEIEHPAHEGNKSTKKHPKKFKGSDADLAKMADWLATLK